MSNSIKKHATLKKNQSLDLNKAIFENPKYKIELIIKPIFSHQNEKSNIKYILLITKGFINLFS